MLDVLNEARRAPAPCPYLTPPAGLQWCFWRARVTVNTILDCTDNVCFLGRRRPFWRTRVCVSTKTGSTREHLLPEVSLAQKAGLLTLV